jgi:hypothetical protein
MIWACRIIEVFCKANIVLLKSSIFWDATPSTPPKFHQTTGRCIREHEDRTLREISEKSHLQLMKQIYEQTSFWKADSRWDT